MVRLQLLSNNLEHTDYMDPFQSGFKLRISMETTSVAFVSDLGQTQSGGSASTFVFLDLSAIFITVNHIVF